MGNKSSEEFRVTTFLATFPPIQSAIKVYGDESGMRIQFDIPETEMGQAARLLAMRGERLRVTVEVIKSDSDRFG